MPGARNPYVRGVRIRLTALAALLAALLAGCQGETEPTFADDANSACEDQYADFANTLALTGLVSGPRAAAATRRELAEATAEATAKLGELEPPPESAESFEAYLFARRAGKTREARSIAAEIGLSVCAQEMESAEADTVEEGLEETFTDPEPICPKHYTARFLEEAFGSEEECALAPEDDLPTAVELTGVRGSAGEFAIADAVLEGGAFSGRRVRAILLYQRSDPVITDLTGLDFSPRPPPAGS